MDFKQVVLRPVREPFEMDLLYNCWYGGNRPLSAREDLRIVQPLWFPSYENCFQRFIHFGGSDRVLIKNEDKNAPPIPRYDAQQLGVEWLVRQAQLAPKKEGHIYLFFNLGNKDQLRVKLYDHQEALFGYEMIFGQRFAREFSWNEDVGQAPYGLYALSTSEIHTKVFKRGPEL